MREYYKEHVQMYLLFSLWLLVGIYGGPLIYLILPATLYLLLKKGMYEEILIGYLFILVLSDSSVDSLLFAKNVKNVYIVILSLIFFTQSAGFQPFNKLYRIFIPFFAMALITMMFGFNESFFFTSVQKTISYILSFMVVPNFVAKLFNDEGEDFLRRFIFFLFTVLAVGFLLRLVSPEIALLPEGRYRGVFGGPNGLGIYCVLSFISFYILTDFFPDLFNKNEKLLMYSAILISIVLCGSRNTVISVLIFYLFQRFFSLSPFLGFLFFLIAVVVSELISSNATAIILSLGLGEYFRTNTIEEGSGRYIAWGFAWKQIQYNFFVGKGFSYNESYMRHHYGELLKLNHQGGIHNSFLTFWFDHGLIGLLIYLRCYILMFIKAAKNTKYAFPILFSISFSAFFESWLVGSLSAFAFLGLFIFTVITSEEMTLKREQQVINDDDNNVTLLPPIVDHQLNICR
ncbi:MAG: hypothetical protein K0Q95_1402 [Bacteroidota bacterium]|jgi:O-antigen ligase|nr:hypothetical protein [Bacteroidota bacterium]